ncbi:MAG: NUDIX hydrolase [Pseudomonadales bacterium]|nr:NUDIX hydrolase [Pseudomonadales bacterium]
MNASSNSSQHNAGRTIQPDGHLHGVIVGCQRADGRWLMIRRSAKVAAPLKISFPGGGMEAGETQAQTAVREMHEEVGAEITPVVRVWQHIDTVKKLTLWGWLGSLQSTQLTACPEEVAEILWMHAREIDQAADVMPRTVEFLQSLQRYQLTQRGVD